MPKGEDFGISADEVFQEIGCEVANHVPADSATDKTHLFNVAAGRNRLLTEISKQTMSGIVLTPESQVV
jgi:hypothetical protein